MKISAIILLLLLSISSLSAQVITEIMVNPATGEEWIEIYNNSTQTYHLNDLTIEDKIQYQVTLGASNRYLSPLDFIVIARDKATIEALNMPPQTLTTAKSGMPGLNNDGDELFLCLVEGDTLDRMRYDADAGKVKGRSWERIALNIGGENADNWAPCADLSGNTAGRLNSVAKDSSKGSSRQIEIKVDPNPFSPDGDGHDDVTKISFHIPVETSRISVILYNLNGRQVRLLQSNIPAGSVQPELEWDGRDNHGALLPVGRYIVFIEAVDVRNGQIYSGNCSVVLAKKL